MKQVINLFACKVYDGAMEAGSRLPAGLDMERLQEHIRRSRRAIRTDFAHFKMLAVNLKDCTEKAFECRIVLDGKGHCEFGVRS